MGEIVLMLHVANVACCNSHGGCKIAKCLHKKTNIIFVTACVIRQKTLSLQHVFS